MLDLIFSGDIIHDLLQNAIQKRGSGSQRGSMIVHQVDWSDPNDAAKVIEALRQ